MRLLDYMVHRMESYERRNSLPIEAFINIKRKIKLFKEKVLELVTELGLTSS